MDHWIVEHKESLTNIREIRTALMALAYEIVRSDSTRAALVIHNSKLSPIRLTEEMDLIRSVLSATVANRLHLISEIEEGEFIGIPSGFPDHLLPNPDQKKPVRGNAESVLDVLLLRYLRSDGQITRHELGELAGTSYPTVAKTVAVLNSQGLIKNGYNRGIELSYFSESHWREWIHLRLANRKSVYFVDATKNMLPVPMMAEFLVGLDRSDIAIGGVLGARKHYPHIDLIGQNRLDIELRGNSKSDLSFVHQIDGGLRERKSPDEPIAVAVHFVERRNPFFLKDDGAQWASELECLLDLYALRLDAQADDMLKNLMIKRDASAKR